ERYAELEASLRRSQADLAASVRVAAIYSVGLRDMNQYVQRFADLYPHARVHIEYLHPDRVYGEVLGGAADFGLVSFPRKARELAVLPWREEEMVLACPPQHPLARQLAVRPEQIDGQKFVGFERGLAVRREVDRFLHKQGVAVHVALEFDNIENIKKAIEVGAGVALLPEPTLRREVQAGTLVAVPLFGCHFARPLGIIYRRHHKPGTTVQRFIDLLRQPDEEPSAHASPVNGAARGRNGSPRGPRKTS
ncbi:MAG TPA: LysR family transcriptional regulator substrate-binding protein, partial [Gemmataceae bacterium]|nr:LysR family transcriptional regulator substrate-binding protein [Gemmataceae bacterium]